MDILSASAVVIDLSDSRTRFESGGSKFVIFKKDGDKPEWHFSEYDHTDDYKEIITIGKIREFSNLQGAFNFAGRLGLNFF